ncbi:MAG: hypothetical protein WCX31_18260 [Salinivirgaceae bacterium]|jgi:hypothetical protein
MFHTRQFDILIGDQLFFTLLRLFPDTESGLAVRVLRYVVAVNNLYDYREI